MNQDAAADVSAGELPACDVPACDVLVIGGGIQGAGCAQAAAAAGYRVCLLEQHDWAAHTSSRSSKLIHGGLRYLETLQLGLVYKSIAERRRLLRLAPSLVRPVPFNIPVYGDSKRRPWQIRIGLSLYSALGGLDGLSRFRVVPRREWNRLGGLDTNGLQRVFQYWDTQTDDRLLTRAVVQSAQQLGARTVVGACFVGARRHAAGYRARFVQQGHELFIDSRVVIDAAGPWVTDVQERIEGAPAVAPVELVQGAHIELAGRISEAVFYVESPDDGRALFVMPWYDNTLVGTTETAFHGDPATVQPGDAEVQYLLRVVRRYFPGFESTVLGSFAGVRVLPRQPGDFNARARDTLLQYDDARAPTLVSLYGGKLTTYRANAEQVVARIGRTLGPSTRARSTRDITLALPSNPTDPVPQ